MDIDELKIRLFNLKLDLNFDQTFIKDDFILRGMTDKERESYFKDIYLKDNIPVNVIDFENSFITKDYNFDSYDNFLSSMDDYVSNMESRYSDYVRNHQIAVRLLKEMLALDPPVCELMYMLYIKKLSNKEVQNRLYLSRPTFFRMKQKGLNKLLFKFSEEK